MTTFTQTAVDQFEDGMQTALAIALKNDSSKDLALSLVALFQGLSALSFGLKATYVKLEQLEWEIRRIQAQAGGRLNG
jgi:hypothetical protein